MSGSEFQANGAAFGDGIYLSTEESVALNFAPRFAVTKRLSRLWGENGGDTHNRMFAEAAKTCDGLKFVFECEVLDDPKMYAGDGDSAQSGDQTSATGNTRGQQRSGAPTSTYLVVKDPGMIRVRRLLVYRDNAGAGDQESAPDAPMAEVVDAERLSPAGAETAANEEAAVLRANPASRAETRRSSGTGVVVDRSNGDDTKSRTILCLVVAALLAALWGATLYRHQRSGRFFDEL